MAAGTNSSSISADEARKGLALLNRNNWRVLIILAIMQICDGYDLAIIGFVAHDMAKEWGLRPAWLGVLLASAQFGSMVSAGALGVIAGRLGRKQTLGLAVLLVGLGSIATPLAPTLPLLVASRVATGLGLGILLPLAIGYCAEFMPRGARGVTGAIMMSCLQVGLGLGGLIAAFLVPAYGWRSVFVAGAIFTLALLPLLRMLPPSTIDLLYRGRSRAEIEAVTTRFGIEPPAMPQPGVPRPSFLLHLRAGGRPMRIAFIAILFPAFLGAFVTYGLISWLPKVLQDDGLPMNVAALCNGLMQFTGVIAGLALFGPMMDRANPFRVVSLSHAVGAAVLVIFGLIPAQAMLILGVALIVGCFTYGTTQTISIFTSITFSDETRVAVMGFLTLTARIAGILAALTIGLIMELGGGRLTLLGLCGAFYVIVAVVMAMAHRATIQKI